MALIMMVMVRLIVMIQTVHKTPAVRLENLWSVIVQMVLTTMEMDKRTVTINHVPSLDPACTGGGSGTPEQDCTNGTDDDGDGAVDCDDSDCSSDAACIIMGAEICDDDGDNDGDGDIDCADADCVGNPCCDTSNPLVDFSECDCTDGFDNNADNVIDCDDTFCQLFDPVLHRWWWRYRSRLCEHSR